MGRVVIIDSRNDALAKLQVAGFGDSRLGEPASDKTHPTTEVDTGVLLAGIKIKPRPFRFLLPFYFIALPSP
jgi:hypothetical protein